MISGSIISWEMGTNLDIVSKNKDMDISAIPPGFESLAPFTLKKSLRRKPGVNYGKYEKSSEDESGSDQNPLQDLHFQKGSSRDVKGCLNCQRVTARWRPEEACRPDLGTPGVLSN
ncbi:hypothetical protein HAX54_022013 [Datura stramonium]|uniref:Uncharacterized protein n=1 Tax=Datura stramonium TaxID=4076 RepID=A0ABS8UTT6_DATST|nr:hypothetical protein [Datura stramonium]